MWIDFYVSSEQNEHTRQIYNLLDLASDFGGVLSAVATAATILLAAISEHSFIVRALQNLYVAKTPNHKLFRRSRNLRPKKYAFPTTHHRVQALENLENCNTIVSESKTHFPIQLSVWNIIRLFFLSNRYTRPNGEDRSLKYMFKMGKEKLETDLNIDRILRSVSDLKCYVKKKLMDENFKLKVQNNPEKVVHIHSSEETDEFAGLKGRIKKLDEGQVLMVMSPKGAGKDHGHHHDHSHDHSH